VSIENRSVSDFDQVRFRGPGTLKITQCEEESLTIHAPAYVMRDIEASVEDGRLKLGYKSPQIVSLSVLREVISYDLKMKDVRKVILSGSGRVLIPDLDNDQVHVAATGAGQIILEHLTADRLEAVVSGSGNIKVVGDVEAQTIKVSGSGNYLAETLISDFANVTVSGSGKVDISVSDELNATISGSGCISYAGYPDIYKRISGSGKIVRRRKESRHSTRGKEHG